MLRTNLTLSLLLLFTITGLFSYASVESSDPEGTDWDTYNLSNHDLSEGELKTISSNSVAAGNIVHTVWMETTQIVGDQQTHELFYRSVPFGNTRKVGFSSSGSVNYPNNYYEFDLQAHENGRVCTTFSNKIWCNDYDEPITFTDRSVVEDKLIMGTDGNSHLVWVENGLGLYQRELFYWHESTQTKRLISNYDTHSYILSLETLLDDGTLHLAWSEYNESGRFTPYYWNSSDQTVQDVSTPNETYANNFKLFKGNDDAIHLFWEAEFESEIHCPAHWTAGNSELLFENQALCGYSYIFQEGGGKFFVTWLLQDNLYKENSYHWNSDLVTPVQIFSSLPNGLDSEDVWAAIGSDNTLHFFWDNTSDLYHWDSSNQTTANLSNGIAGGLSDNPKYLREALFSNDGTMHIIWEEGLFNEENLHYWNTKDETRITISDPIHSNGKPSHLQITDLPANDAQVIWYEDNHIHSWDIISSTTTQIMELAENDVLYELWFATDNSVKAVWSKPETLNSEDDDLFVWEANGSETNLSALANTNGDINSVFLGIASNIVQVIVNDAHEEFILWAEDTGTAEDEDFFVAHPQINLSEKVYLPLIQR